MGETVLEPRRLGEQTAEADAEIRRGIEMIYQVCNADNPRPGGVVVDGGVIGGRFFGGESRPDLCVDRGNEPRGCLRHAPCQLPQSETGVRFSCGLGVEPLESVLRGSVEKIQEKLVGGQCMQTKWGE